MPGQRGVGCKFCSLGIADFTDHDDVGVLTQYRPEAGRKSKTNIGIDLHLVDAGKKVFDRILKRYNVHRLLVELSQDRVKRCRFSRPCRTRYEKHARGTIDDGFENFIRPLPEPELFKRDDVCGGRQNTHHDFFRLKHR